MSDKVFWSILGVILVAVIGVFVGVVSPKMTDYSEATAKLDSQLKAMANFAKKAPDELPSETLLEAKRRTEREWQRGIAAARAFYESREGRIGAPVRAIGGNRANWIAKYRDGFAALAARYREARGLAADAALPFAELEEPDAQADLVQAEKSWRVQSLLIGEVIDAGGEVLAYTAQNRRAAESQSKDDKRPSFTLDQVTLKATFPPTRLTGFLERILGDPDLILEVDELVVGKDPKSLIFDVVRKQERGDPDPVEPAIVFSLRLNILTWSPEAPPAE